ncbi:MAG TPA: ASCH domain-containing protein [Methanocorpusculum sp.]|nr:ASCH domain-containing protein [Methanocorpusculum sp.]
MKVLLSIKPEYADRIFSGEKKYEFRRTIFSRPDVDEVVIYETSPVKRIVGSFTVKKVHKYKPAVLWKKTREYAGIDEKHFFEYFRGCDTAYAIEIGDVKRYESPINPWENVNFVPPQSFVYYDKVRI